MRTPSGRNMWSPHLDRASSSLSTPVVCFLSPSRSNHIISLPVCALFPQTARRSNQLFGQQLQQPQSTSALFCDWWVVTMAATSAVGSGGRTSRRLRWRACRRQRGNVIVMLLQLKIRQVTGWFWQRLWKKMAYCCTVRPDYRAAPPLRLILTTPS